LFAAAYSGWTENCLEAMITWHPLSLLDLSANKLYIQLWPTSTPKEAVNLSKHGISLARWIDLEVFAIVRDDRLDYGEPRYRAYGVIVSSSPFATIDIDRSAFDAHMQRK